ncbi:MAG TPA: ABC transporter permease [Bacteroidota bacterium]|nr:ABC transporter permease [Bacteroidota bacterium]
METARTSFLDFSNVWTICQKELRSYFNSAVAYVVMVVFLVIVGWVYTSSLFLLNVASLRVFFEWVPSIFLFVVPALTMRLMAEEKKAGTIELLTTKPVEDWEIVLGKFLAAWLLLVIALIPTLIYYITVALLGSVDHGAVIGGYLGLILMAAVYVGIGLFASTLTDNQIVAFIIGFLIMALLYWFDKILIFVPGFLTSIVEFLGIDYHFSSIARGVIDTRDIIYFLSLLGFSLYLSVVMLERRKW